MAAAIPSPPAVDAGALVGRSTLRFTYPRLRAAAFAAFVAVLALTAVGPQPTAAQGPVDSVVATARTKLGHPWVFGAIGPSVFDCSGFVYFVYRKTGTLHSIGGRRMTATGYLAWFRRRGLVSRTNGKVGDLVVWGGGSHIGIYLGNGRAISTLTNGVRIHGLYAVRARFTAFLHTGLSVARPAPARATAAEPTVTSAPTPAPTPTTTPAPTPTTTPATVPVTAPAVVPSSYARFTTAFVRLRSGVGMRSRIIRVIPIRSKLIVLGTAHDARGRTWLHVRRPTGASGWVAAWYTAAYAAA